MCILEYMCRCACICIGVGACVCVHTRKYYTEAYRKLGGSRPISVCTESIKHQSKESVPNINWPTTHNGGGGQNTLCPRLFSFGGHAPGRPFPTPCTDIGLRISLSESNYHNN